MNDKSEDEIRRQAEMDVDPRIDLAVERTELALERTHLAWIRTVVGLIVSGFALDKLYEVVHAARLASGQALIKQAHMVGLSLTIVGTLIMLAETIYFYKRTQVLKQMRGVNKVFFPSGLIVSILIFIIGVAMVFMLLDSSDN